MARAFLRRTLVGWGAGAWESAGSQVLTELATNAVIHAHTPFDIQLEFDGEVVRIVVVDSSVRPPIQRAYRPEATTGRGIALVEALTRSWGIEQRDDGKLVWCELVADPATDLPAVTP